MVIQQGVRSISLFQHFTIEEHVAALSLRHCLSNQSGQHARYLGPPLAIVSTSVRWIS